MTSVILQDLKDANASNFLNFAEHHGLTLVKVHKGAKNPVGEGWQDAWSKDRANWERWRTDGFNIGVHAGASRLVTFDLDSKHGGIEAVRALFDAWCITMGMAPLPHHVTTASGGQHVFMKVPDGVDAMALATDLKGTIGAGIEVLTEDHHSVAPGSFFDGTAKGRPSGFYTFTDAALLYEAPPSVIDFCTPAPRKEGVVKVGEYDFEGTKALYRWMAENEALDNDDDWRICGKAAKTEFGDRGLELWEILATRNGGLNEQSLNRWHNSFKIVPNGRRVTLKSVFDIANRAGWKGTVHPVKMFDAVPKTGTGMPAAPDKPRYLFETVSDLRSMPDQAWLADRWIPDHSVGIIYGRFASGKSFIAFDLLLHLVYGMEFWHGIKLHGVACYGLLIAREGVTGFKRRIDAFKNHHGITEDTDRIIFMRSPANFNDVAGFAELKTAVEQCGREFGIVVVDTVGRALPGEDMFDPKSITRFMENLQQLGEISKGVAIGIHHENKSGGVMGSIYFDNNSDFMFHVERDGDPGQGPLRTGTITCVKQKDGEDGWARGVSYKFIETQANGEGSLVVDSFSAAADTAPKVHKPLTSKEGLALKALVDVLKKKGTLGGDIGGRSVTLTEWKEECFRNGSIAPDAAKPLRDLHDRQVGLIDKRRIVVLDDRVRLIGDGGTDTTGNVISMASGLPTSGAPLPPGTPIFPIPMGRT
jgi:Bifunctional DNA primase/polymerase, N-terminal/AAA domain